MKTRKTFKAAADPRLERRLAEQAVIRQAFRKKDAQIRRLEREIRHLRDTLRCVLGFPADSVRSDKN